jgi:magnesium transporter
MKTLESLARSFAESHPESAARALERLDAGEAARVLAALPAGAAVGVIDRLAPHAAGAVLALLSPEQVRALLESMPPKQAASALRHLEEAKRGEAIAGMPEQAARRLQELLRYPPETAGGMMEPQVVAIPNDLSVQEAISLLRKAPRQSLHYLYVTDREGRLAGVLGMRDLLLAAPRDPVEPLVRREVKSVRADMDREEVAGLMRELRYLALPVVTEEGRLLGVVKHDDALAAVQDEAFEDLQRMVGAGGDERALTPVPQAVRRRLPWLLVNLGTAFLASWVIGLFEHAIAQVAALAILMPIVAGQGGNTGAQTLAVLIRGIAVREIVPGIVWRILLKETLVGFANGLAIAAVTAGAVWAWKGSAGLALVIGLAMVVNMTAATLSGAAIPLVLHALKRDPAQSSSIFMTTVTDIVGFASFLGFALAFMPLLK